MDARRIAACCGLTVLALTGLLRAAEPTGFELLNNRLLGIQNHIRNMSVKFDNEIGGMKRASGSRRPTDTAPAALCCSSNLAIIAGHTAELWALLEELASGYESSSNPAGGQAVDRLKQDLKTLAGTANAFEQASDRAQAQGAFAALTQSYLRLKDSSNALQACCPEPAPQSSGKPSKTKPPKKAAE